jgi:ABC-type sugar transport system permease subunit
MTVSTPLDEAEAGVPPRRLSRWREVGRNLHWYLFLAPALLLLVAFMAYPLYKSFELSLFHWKGLLPRKFIGLDNFAELLADGYFWGALNHTLVFACAATIGTVGIGFLLALAISRRVPAHGLYRFAFYLPVMLPMTVTAALWVRIYEANYGLLNTALRAIGLGAIAEPWLGSTDLSLGSIIAVTIWQYAGFPMIVLLAAIEGIAEEVHEAATLDGVTGWTRMRYIVLPMIWPVLLSMTVIQLIFSLKVFDLVWVMTKGGPSESSAVLGTYLYRKAFEQQQYGYASAVAVAMFAVIFTITYLYYRLTGAGAEEA